MKINPLNISGFLNYVETKNGTTNDDATSATSTRDDNASQIRHHHAVSRDCSNIQFKKQIRA